MRSHIGSAAALLTAALIAGGCAEGGTNEESSSRDPMQGGSITVGAAQGIPQLDPAIRTFAWEEVLFPLLWNGLTKAQPDGSVAPDVAESWEQSDGAKKWTFSLRDDVTFSDGTELTADHVVDTFDYYLDPDTATQERAKIEVIDDVAAVDASTVEFTLASPIATFPAAITGVRLLKVDALDQVNSDPIGTGPFTVSEFTPNETISLVRNEDYFGEPAPLDEIRIVKTPDATAAVSSLRSGDLDVMWNMPTGDANQIASDPQLQVVAPDAPSVYYVWEMDTGSGVFADPRARQALSYATDREGILEAAYHGQGLVAPTNNPLATDNPAYGGDLVEYEYDLEKAKSLFAQAGVNEGDTLTWWGIAGTYPEWNTTAQILQASLKEIGITLTIDNNDISTWAEKFYPAGKTFPDMIVPNQVNFPAEPSLALSFLLNGRCECNWVNQDFESDYEDANTEVDDAARVEKWHRAQEIVSAEVPLIVPLQIATVAGTNADITGFWLETGGQPHLEGAGLVG